MRGSRSSLRRAQELGCAAERLRAPTRGCAASGCSRGLVPSLSRKTANATPTSLSLRHTTRAARVIPFCGMSSSIVCGKLTAGETESRAPLSEIFRTRRVLPLWKLRDAPIKERWRGEFRGSLIGWASSMNRIPLEGVTPNLSRTGKREPGRRDGLFATRIFRRRRCAIARRTHCPPAVLTTALVSRICRSLSSWRRLFVTFQLFEARRSRQ